MENSKNDPSRRDMLKASVLSLGGMVPAFNTKAGKDDDKLIRHEIKAIGSIDRNEYQALWRNLTGIDELELNWKIHPEANTVKWIIGHLTWFDEWVVDAIRKKGMYLDSKSGPQSFEESSFSKMKDRFNAARRNFEEITASLKPQDLKTPVEFVPNKLGERHVLSLHTLILAIHPTHLAGHRYQVRFIRGTYSRYANTDKTRFDQF